MLYKRYVGASKSGSRLGSLALTLGVGAAVAAGLSSPTANAEPSDSSATGSANVARQNPQSGRAQAPSDSDVQTATVPRRTPGASAGRDRRMAGDVSDARLAAESLHPVSASWVSPPPGAAAQTPPNTGPTGTGPMTGAGLANRRTARESTGPYPITALATAIPVASEVEPPQDQQPPNQSATALPSSGTATAARTPVIDIPTLIGQAVQAFMSALTAAVASFVGSNPTPSSPGTAVEFSGQASWLNRVFSKAMSVVQSLGLGDALTAGTTVTAIDPPMWLTQGLTVTQTVYDGMAVYELSTTDPSTVSGKYVLALHGGGYVTEPTVVHWWSYTQMVRSTGATLIVPIYPLAPGGTAATVVPMIAELLSSTIAQFGSSNVSVIGDSAGGGLALSAVELLVRQSKPVPANMVLISPWLDVTMTNPGIASITDPLLNLAQTKTNGVLWAGDLDPTDPLVSPLYGSLDGLPPTSVYAGSDELLAPDILVLQQKAIDAAAPFSFTLRVGEVHDWALLPFLDGAAVQPQIYAQLGLTQLETAL